MSAPDAKSARKANEIDLCVGMNIKALRRQKKVTQEALGDAIGLSFKQVRKYESGQNRVSASVLYLIAQVLEVPVDAFYEGLPMSDPVELPPMDERARDLSRLYLQIKKPQERQAFLRLVREVGDSKLFT